MLLDDGRFKCYKCGFPKDLSERCKNKMCKQCFSNYKKDLYRKNPEPTKLKTRAYRIEHRAALKEADVVYNATHKPQIAARVSRWAKANPGKRLEAQQRRRARKRGSQVVRITQEQLAARLSVFDGLCAYCGAPHEHWDHVKPLELGGPHILSNLRPSCARCNLRKGRMPAKEWLFSL